MEVEFQTDNQTVEEMGYAIVERANSIHAQGNKDVALKLRAVGRQFIETSRQDRGEEEFVFKDDSLFVREK